MSDQLSQIFSALSDPTRRKMLVRLSQHESHVSDLAKPFLKDMSLPAVTKHLKVLENAGLITKTKNAQWRSCKLNGKPLKKAADWLDHYCAFWEQSLDRLDDYLKIVVAEKNSKGKNHDTKK